MLLGIELTWDPITLLLGILLLPVFVLDKKAALLETKFKSLPAEADLPTMLLCGGDDKLFDNGLLILFSGLFIMLGLLLGTGLDCEGLFCNKADN
jgi:hypothetical protein